jgi:hypothetical protein
MFFRITENTPAFTENAGVFFFQRQTRCVLGGFRKTAQNWARFGRFFSL